MDPTGRLVAASGRNGTLEIIEVSTGKRFAELAAEQGSFTHAEFLDDQKLLGIVDFSLESPAWTANVWDAKAARKLDQLSRHESEVTALATHPDGNAFAIGVGPTIEVYPLDPSTGALLSQLGGHSKNISQLAFSPDGALLASVCNDETVRIWDWSHETELRRLDCKTTVQCVAFSPDGRTIVTGDHHGSVRCWNTESGQELIHLQAKFAVRKLQFSSDGKRLVCWSHGPPPSEEIRVWTVEQ
jgi:WD40 repeat protein